jgi:hypothetical protein
MKARTRFEKSFVVHLVIDFVQAKGGRFLKQKKSSASWLVLNDGRVREKVGHAIRDAAVAYQNRQHGVSFGLTQRSTGQSFHSAVETLQVLLTSSALEQSCIPSEEAGCNQPLLPALSEHRLTLTLRDTNQSDSELKARTLSTDMRPAQRSFGSRRFHAKAIFVPQLDNFLESPSPECNKQVLEIGQRLDVLNDEFKEMCGNLVDPSPQYSRHHLLEGWVESLCRAEQDMCGESWEISLSRDATLPQQVAISPPGSCCGTAQTLTFPCTSYSTDRLMDKIEQV